MVKQEIQIEATEKRSDEQEDQEAVKFIGPGLWQLAKETEVANLLIYKEYGKLSKDVIKNNFTEPENVSNCAENSNNKTDKVISTKKEKVLITLNPKSNERLDETKYIVENEIFQEQDFFEVSSKKQVFKEEKQE